VLRFGAWGLEFRFLGGVGVWGYGAPPAAAGEAALGEAACGGGGVAPCQGGASQ